MSVTLLLPILNEIEGLTAIVPTIDRKLFDQILVTDGGSRDGSAEWSSQAGLEVYVQKRKGIRHAYIEAWPLIRSEYVITFSPDGNCKAEDLAKLVAELNTGNYDMIIASRYLGDASSEDDSMLTAFGNWMFTFLINTFFRSRYTDAMTIYRGYRTSLFSELELDKDQSYQTEKYFGTVMGIEPLLSIRAAKRRVRVTEIPSDEPKRIYGKRKLQIVRWGCAYLTQIIREHFSWR